MPVISGCLYGSKIVCCVQTSNTHHHVTWVKQVFQHPKDFKNIRKFSV